MGLYAAKSAVLVSARLGINHAAARLLLHMALEVMDTDDNAAGVLPRRYWGGRTMLAAGLGYPVDERDTPAAHQAVKRATSELVNATVIWVCRRGAFGRTNEFELLIHSDYVSDELLLPSEEGYAQRPPAEDREGAVAY